MSRKSNPIGRALLWPALALPLLPGGSGVLADEAAAQLPDRATSPTTAMVTLTAERIGAAPAGVENSRRAWQNWTLNCQGCHRLDGSGSEGAAPNLKETMAKFLWAPGGREYLVRVPGVATSPLSDADLAEVLNWMLWRFDKEHLPARFQPFTAAEIAPLRAHPLRLEASAMRSDLLSKAEATGLGEPGSRGVR